MTHVTLALLEQAPDRQTAELLLISAVNQGVDAEHMRRAWATWEQNHQPKGRSRP